MSARKIDMGYLVRALIKYNASDLHLKVGRPPIYRINGKLVPTKIPPLTEQETEALIFEVLPSAQLPTLYQERTVNMSFSLTNLGRFRCSVYYQRGTIAMAVRMIPLVVPSLDELNLPLVLREFCEREKGLVLVTGGSGAGKSTTLAAMLRHLNENHSIHIITIEDPIEFIHRDRKASITQREVGTDVKTVLEGLYGAMRQDPDVLILGELLQRETILQAMMAAETGHLVMATLHTSDAKSAITRVLDVFPPEAKHQARIQLASSLVGVVTQQLVPRLDGGMIPACEVLVKSPVIEAYILENELNRIPSAIESSNDYYQMQSMNQALLKLVKRKFISPESALKASPAPKDLQLILDGINGSEVMADLIHDYRR